MAQSVIDADTGAEQDFVPVKSADRTLDVLEALASGPASLADLAQRLRIPKSSLHSILRTLDHRGWIETNAARSTYSLGLNALLIGSSYVDQDPTVTRTSDIMDRLAADTGETIHLARLEATDVVYLAKRESVHPLRMFSAIGRRLPAHATALGKILLADLPDEKVRATFPEQLTGTTAHTITSRDALVEHLGDVRRAGYAIDAEEAGLGMRCFAVALPFQFPAKDAISCSAPIARLTPEKEQEIITLLLAAREELSHQFGGRKLTI